MYSSLVYKQSYKSNYTQTDKAMVVPAYDELQAEDGRLQQDISRLM